jgi:hypothetical protein
MQHSILPAGEHVRRAVRWLSDRRREQDGLSSVRLVDEAARRFDLSPLEGEWMMSTFAGLRPSSPPPDLS